MSDGIALGVISLCVGSAHTYLTFDFLTVQALETILLHECLKFHIFTFSTKSDIFKT